MLGAVMGERPTRFQVLSSVIVGSAAALLTVIVFGWSWKAALLALLAFDWAGGVVANAAEPVRAWWRPRPRLRAVFFAVHAVEAPLVYALTGGGAAFAVFAILLAAKLSVFVLGVERPSVLPPGAQAN
ncbi:MAG: hypothetical protein ACFE0P_07280 [Oceanicaulis sp.]